MRDLLTTHARAGTLETIVLRPERRGAVQRVGQATALENLGLEGDHKTLSNKIQANRLESKRQVTLIQLEHFSVIAALAQGRASPERLRRNLVVSGLNLLSLKEARFYVGQVLLEGTGLCQPCSRMEETLGPGGYNAVRGHGGLTARVLSGGILKLGDPVRLA
jgi:MOSC domain-containing protein YiiM